MIMATITGPLTSINWDLDCVNLGWHFGGFHSEMGFSRLLDEYTYAISLKLT